MIPTCGNQHNLSQFEHVFGFALSVYFYAQILPFAGKKSHDMYFCSYSEFSVAPDLVVEKMSVSHANEIEIYNLYFISFATCTGKSKKGVQKCL